MTDFLQKPLKVGNNQLKSRIVMAPLTRVRATAETLAPNDLHVEMYSQRATDGGLLISEATVATRWSIASRHIPGIFNEQQALEWKKVVDAVHAKGGLFSQQLWVQGVCAHHSYKDHPLAKEVNATTCVSASETLLESAEFDYNTGERTPYTPAHALTKEEMKIIQDEYVQSAVNALTIAGSDYVELHYAHGYLFDQFFNSGRNQRTDEYGGSLENRLRFPKETLERIITQFPGRVAVRISPHTNTNGFFGATDSNPSETYSAVVKMLREFDLAYLLITEPLWDRTFAGNVKDDPGANKPLQNVGYLKLFREVNTTTPVFAAGGFTPMKIYNYFDDANTQDEVKYDGVAIGRFYISNPDLIYRLNNKLPLTLYNRATFYVFPCVKQSETFTAFDLEKFPNGYTDYPTFAQQCAAHNFTVEEVMSDAEKMDALISATQNDQYQLASIYEIGNTVNSAEREAAKTAKA